MLSTSAIVASAGTVRVPIDCIIGATLCGVAFILWGHYREAKRAGDSHDLLLASAVSIGVVGVFAFIAPFL